MCTLIVTHESECYLMLFLSLANNTFISFLFNFFYLLFVLIKQAIDNFYAFTYHYEVNVAFPLLKDASTVKFFGFCVSKSAVD